MKLSFSIPKSAPKPTPKPKTSSEIDSVNVTQNNGTVKEYVTEFDPSKTLANSNRNLIIPPKENEWRPHKRMKNLNLLPTLQSDSEGLRFEVATDGHGDDDKSMSYGLNIRQQSSFDAGVEGTKAHQTAETTENLLLEKLKYDLQRLPEDRGFEEFKDVPVEGFGAALLAGYGWHEGRGIGRNAKEDVKVKQYHKRTDKEGLGFVPPASNTTSASINDRDRQKERKIERVRDDHGDGFFVGKDVRVIAGGRGILGLKGRISKRLDDGRVVFKLSGSDEELKLHISDIADLGSKEEEKCLRKLKALQIESKQSKYRDNQKRITESSKENRETVRRDGGQEKDDGKRWLRNHIRVRIISKDLKGGRFYLKKGEVVDVVGPYACDISMDETKELVQGVDQDLLETALPRRGGPVLVLYGKHEGVYGNLVQRDLDQETGVVQDADTHELLNVKLEQIAEYIGDPSYIGY
ncbi:hypothetical protein P3X46_027153 [Hevea brasiliensis]|uniref:G-patch domain-containing protein n=1 Tax=Hevea brasiliensis TaxID=3981 RepID=A0ABQ9L2F3_HEVBR|nr:protein MOS2 [Hevea brasiliensis]XP_057992972.1 protein MOS2 [Hevea brasiliensis]KAJ9153744.1 hypothetical protein P3X46_027153 [Hevea brasiliensis]KAJ9153745.1 hypothetical protein P3X46_027153 [Hevea brasiliensis]